jgi:predicted alpha/beta hydrolase family esterase
MKKRAFIIHGWGGNTEEGCFPWLKIELEKHGFEVQIPAIPESFNPIINIWVDFVAKTVTSPDEKTFFICHSIGSQTILRYLQNLPETTRVGGVVMLAPWINLTEKAFEDENDKKIAQPWLQTEINWEKIKKHTHRFTAIFSDNDPMVPIADAEIFKQKLGAKIIIEHAQGHFSTKDGVTKLPSALNAILEMDE